MNLDMEHTTRGRTYLSVDIGIRNLALCIVEINSNNCPVIHQWEKIDVLKENGINIKNAKHFVYSKLFRVIHSTFLRRLYSWQLQKIDVVLVEQQVGHSRNAKMEGMVAMWLYTHLQKPIVMVSPQWKLRLAFDNKTFHLQDKTQFTSYGQRKNYAIELVNQWLETSNQVIARDFFQRHKAKTKKLSKQDDLADSLLQAIAWHLKDTDK